MSVDCRRFHTFMTQQVLDGADVIAVFEQASGKTVAQDVATHSYLNACGAQYHEFGQRAWIEKTSG